MNEERRKQWEQLLAWAGHAEITLSQLAAVLAAGRSTDQLTMPHDTAALVHDWMAGVWECPACDGRFTTWKGLNRHLVCHESRTEVPPPPCADCGRQLSTAKGLRSHRTQTHPATDPASGASWEAAPSLPAPPGLRAGRSPRGDLVYFVPPDTLDEHEFRELAFDLFSAAGWYPDEDAVFQDQRQRLLEGDLRHAAGVIKIRRGRPGYFETLSPRATRGGRRTSPGTRPERPG